MFSAPAVPAPTSAKDFPCRAMRSARLARYDGLSPPFGRATTSSTSLDRSRRSGATEASNSVFAIMPCAPGRQPVMREGVATRVCDGKTLRALENVVPRGQRGKIWRSGGVHHIGPQPIKRDEDKTGHQRKVGSRRSRSQSPINETERVVSTMIEAGASRIQGARVRYSRP